MLCLMFRDRNVAVQSILITFLAHKIRIFRTLVNHKHILYGFLSNLLEAATYDALNFPLPEMSKDIQIYHAHQNDLHTYFWKTFRNQSHFTVTCSLSSTSEHLLH